MAILKGQNLRILINGKCVGASTSCTVHLAAQTEDSSTKDSTGMWSETTVTGLSWDASADALVKTTTGTADTTDFVKPFEPDTVSGDGELMIGPIYLAEGAFIGSEHISTAHGDSLQLWSAVTEDYVGQPGGWIQETIDAAGDYYIIYHPEDENLTQLSYSITDVRATNVAALEDILEAGTPVDVKFCVTGGDMNRNEQSSTTNDNIRLTGKAIVSDLSITAANRANSTYTLQLTGTSTLYQNEEYVDDEA